MKKLLRKLYFSKRLNPFAVRLYSLVHAKPFETDLMEFEFDVWNGICSFHSVDGRQIGENNTSPELFKETIPTEHKICNFEGSRNGLPINVTALRSVLGVWDDVLQYATLLRNKYLIDRGIGATRMNLIQSYVYSKIAPAYVSYLARRANDPLKDGSLPLLETAFFTLGVGPFMVVRSLMERGDRSVLVREPLSAVDLYEVADRVGALVSASGKGCAGSKKLILDFLDVAMNGSYSKELNSKEAARAFSRIEKWDEFYDYLYSSSRIELLVKLYKAIVFRDLSLLAHSNALLSGEERDHLDAVLRASFSDGVETSGGLEKVEAFIEICAELLRELEWRPDDETQQLLSAGALLEELAVDDAAFEKRGAFARRARRAGAMMLTHCRMEMKGIYKSLGRTARKDITMEMFLQRCGGQTYGELLRSLEREISLAA